MKQAILLLFIWLLCSKSGCKKFRTILAMKINLSKAHWKFICKLNWMILLRQWHLVHHQLEGDTSNKFMTEWYLRVVFISEMMVIWFLIQTVRQVNMNKGWFFYLILASSFFKVKIFRLTEGCFKAYLISSMLMVMISNPVKHSSTK